MAGQGYDWRDRQGGRILSHFGGSLREFRKFGMLHLLSAEGDVYQSHSMVWEYDLRVGSHDVSVTTRMGS